MSYRWQDSLPLSDIGYQGFEAKFISGSFEFSYIQFTTSDVEYATGTVETVLEPIIVYESGTWYNEQQTITFPDGEASIPQGLKYLLNNYATKI